MPFFFGVGGAVLCCSETGKNNAECFLSAHSSMVNTGCQLKVYMIVISQGKRTINGRRKVGLQYTLADLKHVPFGVFCLSLLQKRKETEQLKSFKRSFY